jgi:beta-glucosidase
MALNREAGINDTSYTIDQKGEALLSKMTLEEKIGQMNQYNGFRGLTGPLPKDGDASIKYDNLRKGYVGSMLYE